MNKIKLTNKELQILQTVLTYAVANDANIFVADDLVISDDQAQAELEQLQHRVDQLIDKKG